MVGWTHPVWGAPITFNTALPVAEGEFIAREQLILNQSGHDPGLLQRDRRAVTAVSVLGYGVIPRLAVFGVLPYHNVELNVTPINQRQSRHGRGFGDLTVIGRYSLVQQHGRGRNFSIAPFLGIKVPTGDDDQRDDLGRQPPAIQPGTGSWDPLVGVVSTYSTLNYQLDGQLSYQTNNAANGFERGNVARADVSLQKRLWPRSLGSGAPAFIYGVFEVNLMYQQRNRIQGSPDPDSGGTRLFLTPGIQYVTQRWIGEAAVQIPVRQNLNRDTLENDYIARFSIRFNF